MPSREEVIDHIERLLRSVLDVVERANAPHERQMAAAYKAQIRSALEEVERRRKSEPAAHLTEEQLKNIDHIVRVTSVMAQSLRM
ncbi:MAG TPA: hypothetical protein VMA09_19610 [Candidatus Binataceae bacterium]|nr:hypothetical protein [Candidatus Binataceae bacterium]